MVKVNFQTFYSIKNELKKLIEFEPYGYRLFKMTRLGFAQSILIYFKLLLEKKKYRNINLLDRIRELFVSKMLKPNSDSDSFKIKRI